jgi:hypothetical protein
MKIHFILTSGDLALVQNLKKQGVSAYLKPYKIADLADECFNQIGGPE